MIPIRMQVTAAVPVFRKQSGQKREAVKECRAVGGEGAAGELDAPIRVEHLRPDDSDPGLFIEMAEQLADVAADYPGVRVEPHDVAPRGFPQPDVDRCGE